jgi:hypothetical protein
MHNRKSRSMERIIRKATKIEVHPTINTEDGFSLGRSTKALIHDLRHENSL